LNIFCTLFDSVYLSKGLAMYESLRTHIVKFHLFIFAFDSKSDQILKRLELQNVTVISLDEFETPWLREVKKSRSKAEYCWTCTPSIISYVLNKYDYSRCTYLDADLLFYSDPSVLIEEMVSNQKNVLITEHRFSPLAKFYEQKRAGRFCVQFITFSNEADSIEILERWRLQCMDWCYARYEEGRFGDQKYLDEWPVMYRNIHILNHDGGGVAPWNLQNYNFVPKGNNIIGTVKKTGTVFHVVFFHFQYVKYLKPGFFDIGWYYIPLSVKRLFYLTYLKKILDIEERIVTMDPEFSTTYNPVKTDNLMNLLKAGLKKVFCYNIMKLN
jgi:hypothetical protein